MHTQWFSEHICQQLLESYFCCFPSVAFIFLSDFIIFFSKFCDGLTELFTTSVFFSLLHRHKLDYVLQFPLPFLGSCDKVLASGMWLEWSVSSPAWPMKICPRIVLIVLCHPAQRTHLHWLHHELSCEGLLLCHWDLEGRKGGERPVFFRNSPGRFRKPLYEFPIVPVTNYHGLTGLKQHIYELIVLEIKSPKSASLG